MKRLFGLVLFFFCTIHFGLTANELILTDESEIFDPSSFLTLMADSTNKLHISDIISSDSGNCFISNQQPTINLGVNKNSYWFKFELLNQTKEENWFFEIDYPTLNSATIYVFDSQKNLDTLINSGIDYRTPEVDHFSYSLYNKLHLSKNEKYTVYIRVKTDSFIILPMKLMATKTFIKNDRNVISLMYLVYGLILALIAFNFILFILTCELNYLLLSIYLFVVTINAYYLYGYGFELFPHVSAYLQVRMRQILFGLGSIMFLIFSIYYLDLRKYKNLFKLYKAIIAFGILFILLNFVPILPVSDISRFSTYLYLAGSIMIFSSGVYTYRKGEKVALYYIVSFSVIVLASVVYFLTLFGYVPFTNFTFNINSYSTALFGMLLTIGLVEKITAIREEQEKRIQQELLNKQLFDEIEERIKIEKDLRSSEEKFRLLYELSPMSISLTEMETGNIVDVNPLMEQMVGFSKEELCGKTSLELQIIQPSDRIKIVESIKKNRKILGMELFLYPKNKQPIECLIYSHLAVINGKNILISVFSNISKIKNQQEEINLLSSALSQTANAVVITNLEGKIEYVNPSLLELTGYQQSELIGMQPSIFKSGLFEADYYKNLWETILDGRKWTGEFYNRKKDNSFFWDRTTISPVYNNNGVITKFIAIKEDITEKKEQQEALQKSEKRLHELNATKDKFFSIIAHDLMNPLNATMGFTNLLIESIRTKEYDLSLNYASIIDQSSKRIYELLQNLLIWSRSQSNKITFNPSNIKVIELIMNSTNVLKSLAEKKNIDFEILIDERDSVCVDQNMIETVLRNIITNAIKFSDVNDKIKISAANLGDHFLFSIIDNGLGMDDITVKELFKLEKSSLHKNVNGEIGTGLGMIISSEFISLHKGKIWAESKPGKGSKFYFTIPN